MSSKIKKRYEDIGIPFSYWSREIEVVCPRCDAPSLVKQGEEVVQFICLSCGKSETIKYINGYSSEHNNSKENDPFFHYKLHLKEPTPYGMLWVYNADQLSHLKAYIGATLREKKVNDKYFDYYKSYFHKLPSWIKSAKNREMLLKKIAILEKKTITKSNFKTPSNIGKEVDASFFYRWNFKYKCSWSLLKDREILDSDCATTYYPSFDKNSLVVRSFTESKLLTSKRSITEVFIKNEKILSELSLISTTKLHSYRHIKENNEIEYLSLEVLNLNACSFSAKELLMDIAEMEISKSIIISEDMIHFERGDGMVKFKDTFASNFLKAQFGFTKGAWVKVMESIK